MRRLSAWAAAVLVLMLTGCSETASTEDLASPSVAEVHQSLAAPDGAALFLVACAGCHRVGPDGPHDVGPNLFGIIGQPAAVQADYAYSSALSASGLSWDRASLAAWIAATETLVPGTTMSYANILSGEEVARLVDHLLEVAYDSVRGGPPAQ